MDHPNLIGEEVVVSGISGRCFGCNALCEFRESLMPQETLDKETEIRKENDAASCRKEVSDGGKFDSDFFENSEQLDPQIGLLLEVVLEAITDAGINFTSMKGSNTGVFVGVGDQSSQNQLPGNVRDDPKDNFKMTLSKKVGHLLQLNDQDYEANLTCCTSFVALERAYSSLRDGVYDCAIVVGTNKPHTSKTEDSVNEAFPCVVMFLQNAKEAKRIYAQVVHARRNREEIPEEKSESEIKREQFLESFYNECNVDPAAVSFIQIDDTKDAPLQFPHKSNARRMEKSNCDLCSIVKAILALETGSAPSNIHLESWDQILQEKVKVVKGESQTLGEYVAINSCGYGGPSAHVLLRKNNKEKSTRNEDGLSKLFLVSGRTEVAVKNILERVLTKKQDDEFLKLLSDVYAASIPGHSYRAYAILNGQSNLQDIQYYSGEHRPLWFVFPGIGCQWTGMGKGLLKFNVFRRAVGICARALKPLGIDIFEVLNSTDTKTLEVSVNSYVAIATIEVGLTDMLHSFGIFPDGICGHSAGEIMCAYADGCFTREETVLAAYYRGLATLETPLIKGAMAVVGLPFEKLKERCPPEVDIACSNGPDNCAASGPADVMEGFVSSLKADGIYVQGFSSMNIAFHSRYIADVGPRYKSYLQQIIPKPKARSKRWVSSSVPVGDWETPGAKVSSPEYHTNNLTGPVLFAQAIRYIPANAIVVEVTPRGIFQAVLRRSLSKTNVNIPLCDKDHNNVEDFLSSLGKMYLEGAQIQSSVQYEHVTYPVSRGTPMISPLVG